MQHGFLFSLNKRFSLQIHFHCSHSVTNVLVFVNSDSKQTNKQIRRALRQECFTVP